MQFTRPDLSSRLSRARLCHCSFSSLAGCPTPEEKNKKDETPALPRRVNRCLSPWELLPPQTPPRMTSYLHRAGGLRHRDGTGQTDTYVSRKDLCSCSGGRRARRLQSSRVKAEQPR